MKTLITREQLRDLNAQSWEDFKCHWPMELFRLFVDICGGFAFGLCLCLALFLYALENSL